MTKYHKIVYVILSLILILAYFLGALEIVGISKTINKATVQFLIFILFIFALIKILIVKKFYIYSGLAVGLIGLIVTITISYLINDYDFKYLLLFVKELIFPFLFIVALINIKLPKLYIKKLFTLLIVLAIVQVLATVIKLFTFGFAEKYIGTMSVMEGSVATIFPLLVISFVWTKFLYDNKYVYLLYLIPFLMIGLVSRKLGIIPYAVIIIIILNVLQFSQRVLLKKRLYVRMILIVIISIILVYSFGRLNDRISDNNTIGGKFNITKVIDFTLKYITHEKTGLGGWNRLSAPVVVFNKLNSGTISNLLFGFGPGHLVLSRHNHYEKPLSDIYNIGYGGRTGFIWILLQIGLIGVISLTFIHISFLLVLLKNKKNKLESKNKVMILTSIGFIIIFFIDFFTYSQVILVELPIYVTYYFIIYSGILKPGLMKSTSKI